MISVNLTNSTAKGFDLSYVYFGCQIGLENGPMAAPVGCTPKIARCQGAPGDNDIEFDQATWPEMTL